MHLSRIGISVAVGIAAALWALYLFLLEGRLPSWSDLKPFSFVVGSLVLIGLWFEHQLWRTSLFQRFLSRPDIRGTWKGEIVARYVHQGEEKTRDPIACFLSVTQSYSSIQMRLLTEESQSWLIADDIAKSPKGSGYQVVGAYTNQPNAEVRDKSDMHFGAMWLDTHGDDCKPNAMSGEYWTDRYTKGSITLNEREDEIQSRCVEAEAAFSETDE